MHSDNAPSHFKSSQTMNYLTKLPTRLTHRAAGTGMTFRVFWEFGAPGHGKGVWDGIGAWIKRTVRQDIVDHRPPRNSSILTSEGIILSAKQVAEHLKVQQARLKHGCSWLAAPCSPSYSGLYTFLIWLIHLPNLACAPS
jgi:hypothetical protein